MLSSDWLMKGVFFFQQFLVFSAFPPLPGYFIFPPLLVELFCGGKN